MAKKPTVVLREEDVPAWRQCPICYGTLGSKGVISGEHEAKSTKYLKCPNCGHSWSAVVKVTVVVESVNLNLPIDPPT